MPIEFLEAKKQFHLFNDQFSYIMQVLPSGHLVNLYTGKRVSTKKEYDHLIQIDYRALNAYPSGFSDKGFSLQHLRQEFPAYGTSDFRTPAIKMIKENGSSVTNFVYANHTIYEGKRQIEGLPHTYVEDYREAQTVEICLVDEVSNVKATISYTIFETIAAISRHVCIDNNGTQTVRLSKVDSLSIDFPDFDYQMMQLDGAWARERHVHEENLRMGTQGFESTRGISSAEHSPFVVLKRKNTTEFSGEAFGVAFVYSGNFRVMVEVDPYETTRLQVGINPASFEWELKGGESFQTPEAVMVYTSGGLNEMSHSFHTLFQNHLMRGFWKEKPRPVLYNNWEATTFHFEEHQLFDLAEQAADLGAELFVLDDGWFGSRRDDRSGLGDWFVSEEKFPNGLNPLIQKVEGLGMRFGLWIEPEMVNKASDLYRNHPDWLIGDPDYPLSPSRNQYILDLTRQEVVEYLYTCISDLLKNHSIQYIKWDMNRYMTEPFSRNLSPTQQGELNHRYILQLYQLYDRLTTNFPEVLFESCSSGGARFDPGLLYYAPQVWTSDDTDAIERLKIQYGTSMLFPLVSMGAHVSESPNQQVGRVTPLETRGNVAFFGNLGYELDLAHLTLEEKEAIKQQILTYKKHRELFQFGTFSRLVSPFKSRDCAWQVISKDKSELIVGYYQTLNTPNRPFRRVKLTGLDEKSKYLYNQREYTGSELMYIGLPLKNKEQNLRSDFSSVLLHFTKE